MSQFIDKPWGKEILLTDPSLPYVGKILKIKAGSRLSLQYHDQKTETLTLVSGQAVLQLGQETKDWEINESVTIKPLTQHRISAITDTTIFEVSTPQTGTTFRLEDDYKRGDEIL